MSLPAACFALLLGAQEPPPTPPPAATTAATQPAATLLRHGLAPGAAFAFAIEVEAAVELDAQKQNSRLRFRLHFGATVGPATSGPGTGAAVVTCRLARIEAEVHQPGASVAYDSSRHTDAGPLDQLAELVGKDFLVAVDDRGTIASVTVPPTLAAVAKERLGTDFESLFAAYFLPLPTSALAIGDGWDAALHLVTQTAHGAPTVRVDNRLLSVADGRATIGRTLHLQAPPQRPGVTFHVQKAAGTAVLDLVTGRVVTAELELIARAVRAGDAPAAQGGQASRGTSTLRIRAATE